jgi:ferredoxin/Na+-translocating ferredoxin:NAD+ oxidoreductase RnfG subunit
MSIPLGKTRRVVGWRLAVVLFLVVMALAYSEGTFLQGQGTTSQTTIQVSTTTQISSTQSVSTSQTTSQTETSRTTHTINPEVSSSEIAKMNETTLERVVNRTGVSFSLSTTAVPYVVVTDNLSGNVVGLAYLTTDVAFYSSYGFSGPIAILVYVNTTGTIEGVRLWAIWDSYGGYAGEQIVGSASWYTSPVLHAYLNSFVNRSVFQPLQLGNDVQGITGATFTSTGVASGIRDGGRVVVEDFQQSIGEPGLGQISLLIAALGSMDPRSALTILLLLGLFAGALLSFWAGRDWAKYTFLLASVVFLGLYAGRMVSINDFPIFLSGYFPPFNINPYWYVLYGGVLVTSLIWGRVYCGYLCPFGAVTELLNAVSPVKLRMPEAIHRRLVYAKYVVFAVAVILVYAAIKGVTTGSYFFDVEPFSALFLGASDVVALGFLGVVLVSSALFSRFYCSYICPAGAGLSILGRLRVQEIRRWPECEGCRVCERGCPTGAISRGRISPFECMNCRKCETNFLNAKICPHYATARIGGIPST